MHIAITWTASVAYAVAGIFIGSDRRRFKVLWIGGVAATIFGTAIDVISPTPSAPSAPPYWQMAALAISVFFTNGYFFFQWMPARPVWRLAYVIGSAGFNAFDEWLLARALSLGWGWPTFGQVFLADIFVFSALVGVYESLDIRKRLNAHARRRGLWSWSWPAFGLIAVGLRRACAYLTRTGAT